jgi:chromosome segregation ATPase
MGEYTQYILPVVTAVVGWLGANIKSRRANKQTDLQIINEAIQPLLKSIKELTDHNRTLTGELVEEQKKTLALVEEKRALLAERGDLVDKVEKLGRQVATLTKEVKMLRAEREPGSAHEPYTKQD